MKFKFGCFVDRAMVEVKKKKDFWAVIFTKSNNYFFPARAPIFNAFIH